MPVDASAPQRSAFVWSLAIAALLESALLALDIVSDVIYTGGYLLAPLALALTAGTRVVLAAGAVAIVLALLSGLWNDYLLSGDHLVRTVIVGLGCGIAYLLARARQAAQAARRRLEGVLGALAEAVIVTDTEGCIAYANAAAVELLEVEGVHELTRAAPRELMARFIVTREDGSVVALEDLPAARVIAGKEAPPLLTHVVERVSGRERWLLTKAALVRDDRGSPLAVNILEDVTAAREADLRQRFLDEAGQALASSLDYERTLERVAQLAVPDIADWCAVDMLEEPGRLVRVALAHADPEKVALGRELYERHPPDLSRPEGLAEVLRTGRSQLFPEIPDELLTARIEDPEQLAMTRALGLRSLMMVPMRVGDATIGVITFVTAESRRAFDEADLAFAEDLAFRAGVAVENARLYTQRAHTAQTLQASLLPDRLPEVPGFQTAALYRPGERGSEVGGDFYDILPLSDSAMVAIGDVTGKGVEAAALTAMVRHTVRTAARFDRSPQAVLALVDQVLREAPSPSYVTVAVALLRGQEALIAAGGHPLPLLLGDSGEVREVGHPGLLLGARTGGAWPEQRVTLQPGQTLLFFTDGVTDLPGETERFGEQRLREVAAAGPPDAWEVVSRIEAALQRFVHGSVADDLALLAIQYTGARATPADAAHDAARSRA